MQVPLLDLKAQYASIKQQLDEAVAEVVDAQWFILGPKVKACEEAIAAYSECEFAVGVSSGTDALLIALMAEEIGPGDEVLTTPYSFFATAGVVARLGATPVFVDIDPATCNIDPDLIAAKITPRTKVIMPVHLFGQMAEMEPIMELARERGIVVVEDAAQAIGAAANGRRAGSIGDYGCFSFFPSKNLGCYGDGGMVVTNDPARAERLSILRVHGGKPKYHHQVIGGNFRLDALHAAVVLAKLPHLDSWTAGRQENARSYDRLFGESGLVERGQVQLPEVVTDRHIFNQYVIRLSRRDEVQAGLKERGIGTEVYYPIPLPLQECFSYLEIDAAAIPHSVAAARQTLALPIYPELTGDQQQLVVDSIAELLA